VDQRKQARGRHQHFIGSWARLNCENMPVIPAWLVRSNLNDPRKIPYLLVWKDERHDGKIMEVVRLAHFIACGREGNDYVELKRTDESATTLRIVWRMLPRNGGRALFLFCPHCETPRRHVYGWEWDSVSGWSNRVRSISGDVAHALGCGTHPKVGICVQQDSGDLAISASCWLLMETCHGRSCGSPTCSLHPKRRRKLAHVNWRP
jgi:hypothetical protein